MNSPERGSLVTAGEEENNPIIVAGIRHSYYQCKMTQNFTNIIILTVSHNNHPNTPTP
jgi:hypothetical protein